MAFSKLLNAYMNPALPVEDDDAAPASSSAAAPAKKSKKTAAVVSDQTAAAPSIAKTINKLASGKKGVYSADIRALILLPLVGSLIMFVYHCTFVTSSAYSSPSVVLASRNADGSQHIIDDFREAYYWLRQNTKKDAVVMSWWDYGYQIAGMADRPTMVDNNTWNNTHIATVGKAMSTNEEKAYPILRKHDVDYILVIFGGLLGYSGDDINKFLWMVRISQGVWPEEIQEPKYFTARGEYKVDAQASQTMKDSLMYKMSYYRFTELFGGGQAVDRVRQQVIPNTPIQLDTLGELPKPSLQGK